MATTLTNVGMRIYSNKVIDALKRRLASIYAFSLDLSPEAAKVGEKIEVPLITADAADDFNASTNNYKASQSDLLAREVYINKRKLAKFGISDAQAANHAPSWYESRGMANANSVAAATLTDIFGLITADNFGDEDEDKIALTLANCTAKGMASVRGAAVKKNLNPGMSSLVLHPDYFSALLGNLDANIYGGAEAMRTGIIPGLLGFDQVIEGSGLAADQKGFVCHKDAIAIGNRHLAPVDPTSYSEVGTVTDDESGLTVGIRKYGDPDTGLLSVSSELCYGREIGNADALLRIV